MILGGIFGGVIGGMLLLVFTLWYINKRKRDRAMQAAKLEATEHGDSLPLMASPWEYNPQSQPTRPATGYDTPPQAPTPSVHSTATGEPWLSPNVTPMAGTFSPAPLSHNDPPPPLFADSAGFNRR